MEEEETAKGPIFEIAEVWPSFPGGDSALFRWLNSNIQYPAEAEEKGETGRVLVSFVIECDGSTSCVRIIEGASDPLNKEAIRVIRNMPNWIPGRNNGEAVRCRFSLPVTFRRQ